MEEISDKGMKERESDAEPTDQACAINTASAAVFINNSLSRVNS